MYNTLKHFYNLHVYLPAIRYPKLYCPLPSIILVQLNIVLQFPIYITCEVSVFCQILSPDWLIQIIQVMILELNCFSKVIL